MSEHDAGLRLVKVFAVTDAGMIALAKSLLEGEQLEYSVRGELLQNLGIPAFGPVEFWVRDEDAQRASEVLDQLMPVRHGS